MLTRKSTISARSLSTRDDISLKITPKLPQAPWNMVCPSGKRTCNPESRNVPLHSYQPTPTFLHETTELVTFDRGDYSYGLTPAFRHAVTAANIAADSTHGQP